MKIIHLTNNDFDGAGKAVLRLHKALLKKNHDSKMLVYRKYTDSPGVIQVVSGHPLSSFKDIIRNIWFSFRFLLNKLTWYWKDYQVKPKNMMNHDVNFVNLKSIEPYIKNCDVICVHSVQLYLSSKAIKDIYDRWKKPMFWTIMDIEPLTGGCHFNDGCLAFTDECDRCPQVAEKGKKIVRRNWQSKIKNLSSIPFTLVAPTDWAERQIIKSRLYKDKPMNRTLIGVDNSIYHPGDKNQARDTLGISHNAKVIVFGSFNLMSERKGGEKLCRSIKILREQLNGVRRDVITLVTFGHDNGFPADRLGIDWIHLGFVDSEEETAKIYQAADVYACPSVDDCGPMMINEAIMCATPVVSFDSGVAPDLIINEHMGYLAECYSEEDFAQGLRKCLFEITTKEDAFSDIHRKLTPEYFSESYIRMFERALN